MTRRTDKLNELLKEVVADLVRSEIQFSEEAMVTVTRVSVSPDLHYANVFVTVFAGGEESGKKAKALSFLNKNAAVIQRKLNRKVRMRPVPRIAFLLDEEEERRERVEKLLAEEGK